MTHTTQPPVGRFSYNLVRRYYASKSRSKKNPEATCPRNSGEINLPAGGFGPREKRRAKESIARKTDGSNKISNKLVVTMKNKFNHPKPPKKIRWGGPAPLELCFL